MLNNSFFLYLTQNLVDTKIAPFTSSLIVESLGEAEPELLSAVTEHVLAHKAAAELTDELEAVSPREKEFSPRVQSC